MIMKGQMINDRYQIIKTIGEGGMANVYLAYDTILDRDVAVKVLRGDLATDEKFVRRFQREALSASSLSHPNIVEVYDVGEDNGSYYIVMEYIEGKHLKQLIKKRGNLTLTEVIDIMLQVADGMSAAHDSYIIHRDIKPQNIMILENGLIKITDFGIAMALNSTQLTQTNSVMGSVHYLPPEQASGKGATIQSDIYSMGILMYELLTGVLPFRGDNAVEIALKQIKEPFPSIREQLPNIPQSIENIIIKATAKNPKNRYSDARELYDDLKTALSDERISEPKYTFQYPEVDDIISKKKNTQKNNETTKVEETKTEKKVETKKADAVKEEIPVKKVSNKNEEESDIKIKKVSEKDIKRSENKFLIFLAVVFTALVLVVATTIVLLPKLTTVKSVAIPDVTGMTIVEAEEALRKAGFEVETETKDISSGDVPEGNVVKTSPQKGRKIKVGTYVTLYVSTGENAYIVEELKGKNYIEIKAVLEKMYSLSVTVKKVKEKAIDGDSNKILRTEPEAGTKLYEGDDIILVIPDLTTEYPDFTNGKYTLSDIESWAELYGVIFNRDNNVQYVETSEYKAGTIISQNHKKGEDVTAGQELVITIADEPAVVAPEDTEEDFSE